MNFMQRNKGIVDYSEGVRYMNPLISIIHK